MNDALLIGFYNKNNYGDDVMLKMITSTFNNFNFTISEDPRDLDKFDTIFIGGGGIVTSKLWVFKYIEKLRDKKIIFLNVNVTDDIYIDELVYKLKILNTLWIVRDTYSRSLLKKESFNVYYIPDIAILHFNTLNKISHSDKNLSIVLNHYAFKGYFDDNSYKINYYLKEIADFCKWMMTFGWKIHLVPAQTNKLIDDRLYTGVLHGLLNNESNWILNYDQIEPTLLSSDIIISTRYHTSLLAITKKILLLDICHHAKNTHLLDDVDLNNYIHIDQISDRQLKLMTTYIEQRGNTKDYELNCNYYLKNIENKWKETIDIINKFYE